MTRGRFVLLTNDGIYTSVEFNGDMYFEGGCGNDAVAMLADVEDLNDFVRGVRLFNDTHHRYEDIEPDDFVRGLSHSPIKDVEADDYSQLAWTDYTFWKNVSDNEIAITHKSLVQCRLKPGEVAVLNFGKSRSELIAAVSKVMSGSGAPNPWRIHLIQQLDALTEEIERQRYTLERMEARIRGIQDALREQ